MTKKKFKDFTIGEVNDICNKYYFNPKKNCNCRGCPFIECCPTGALSMEGLELEIEVKE